MDTHDKYAYEILREIDAGHRTSQRSIATRLGIALGLTNLLVRRLVRKGWVRVIRVNPRRVSYLLTPAGIAEKARMSHVYLRNSLEFYVSARERVRVAFTAVSENWPGDGPKRVVFLGVSELAEIGFVCLQGTDLSLVGVVDDRVTGEFLGMPVKSFAELPAFDEATHVMVTSLQPAEVVRMELTRLGIVHERVTWI